MASRQCLRLPMDSKTTDCRHTSTSRDTSSPYTRVNFSTLRSTRLMLAHCTRLWCRHRACQHTKPHVGAADVGKTKTENKGKKKHPVSPICSSNAGSHLRFRSG
eukprot:3372384-Rhodomonas_salina.1